MSQALVCDRCREFFIPYELGEKDEFMTIKECVVQSDIDVINNEISDRLENVHLCPKCTKEWFLFMNGDKPKPYTPTFSEFMEKLNNSIEKAFEKAYKEEK